MKIQNPQAVVSGLDPLAARRADQPPVRGAGKQLKSEDGDALDLSLSARVSELSSQMAAGLAEASPDLPPERMAQIRSRIGSGFYSQPETAVATADQLFSFYGH